MKRLAPILAIFGVVGLWGVTAVVGHAANAAPARQNPVIFVHGYTAQYSLTWTEAKPVFLAAGITDLTEFNYNSTGEGARVSAAKLATTVNNVARRSATGKVDIVAHSEGNLVTETCIVLGGCAGKVSRWVNMSGAQNGTYLAAVAIGGAPGDMNPLSTLITTLNLREGAAIRSQGVKSITFYSLTDGIIVPGTQTIEGYAVRNVPFVGTHFTVFLDPGVLSQSVAFLKAG